MSKRQEKIETLKNNSQKNSDEKTAIILLEMYVPMVFKNPDAITEYQRGQYNRVIASNISTPEWREYYMF